jgi:hypothetical protein
MQVSVIKKTGIISLFDIQLDGDETHYRFWDYDERHAIRQARIIANTVNLITSALLVHGDKP